MLTEKRRAEIVHILRERGVVHVKDLSQRFKTSEVTIRADLNDLHKRGLVHRSHGGAIMPEKNISESPLAERMHAHAPKKQRIGAAAAALITDGQTIILDSGTTTHEIAKRIKDRENLRVITNGVNVAMELVGVPGIRLFLLGGVMRENSFSAVGHFAEDMLGHFSADKLFLGAVGCDFDFGLSTSGLDEARVNEVMIKTAREKILVADSSKFGKRSMARIAALDEMDTVITDQDLDDDYREEIRRRNLNLILV